MSPPTRLRRPLPGERVHFVGIGGVGMAALAELLVAMGYRVSGSDLQDAGTVRRLADRGVRTFVGAHRAENLPECDHVVVTAAAAAENPEVGRARELGIPVLTRAQALGAVFDAGRGVAVAGTHGKTTTSAMLATALDGAGMHPSWLVGGEINEGGSGGHLGTGNLVVAEADEFQGSFFELRPELAVVTNVDTDHLDFFASQQAIDDAFVRFLSLRRSEGAAVVCADDPGVGRILGRVNGRVVTYGMNHADYTVRQTGGEWRVYAAGSDIGLLRPPLPGRHNVSNATAAVAAAVELGADPGLVLNALASFSGVDRRFSVRGRRRGVTVVDDYAHNPVKVAAALQAASEAYPGARIVALFQPHLYSRTKQMSAELASALTAADVVVVTDVYASREQVISGVTGELVTDALRTMQPSSTVLFVAELSDAAGTVAGLVRSGDVVLTLGAGDVTTAAGRILELLGAGS